MNKFRTCLSRRVVTISFVLLVAAFGAVFSAEADKVRPPFRAGQWYERDPQALKRQLAELFALAKRTTKSGKVVGVIAPHAGFIFSGEAAASAYRLLDPQRTKRVIILGTNHTDTSFRGLALSAHRAFDMPLGEVAVDRGASDSLSMKSPFVVDDRLHRFEHSIESQLPFLQTLLKDFTIVPVVVGHLSAEERKSAAAALSGLLDGSTVLVASSDFTHYGEAYDFVPFKEDVPKRIKELDMGAIEKIKALEARGFLDYCEETSATICGREPIALLLESLPKESEATLVEYYTSGDLTGDHEMSVSYASIVFSLPEPGQSSPPPKETSSPPPLIAAKEKALLLKIARDSLSDCVNGREPREPTSRESLTDDALFVPGAAFVTLKERGLLRGCIGEIVAWRPLCESVRDNAAKAALADPRFKPVSPEDLPLLSVEISVLSPLEPVNSPSEIEIGRDGVLLVKGLRRAVFLPQVAPEQGWNREELLDNLSLKAGLPRGAWKDGSRIYRFTAEVFGEDDERTTSQNAAE